MSSPNAGHMNVSIANPVALANPKADRFLSDGTMKPLPPEDLKAIVESVDWESLRGARILVTGGTGFIGSWLVESFAKANRELSLNAQMHILTRHHSLAAPCYYPKGVKPHQGDVRILHELGCLPELTHIIHAACPADAKFTAEHPEELWSIIVDGTRSVLSYANKHCLDARILYLSSGSAVHRPWEPYGEGKRAAEMLCRMSGLQTVIARPFALVGPGLPLDKHYAIGNFIRMALEGGPVKVEGGLLVYRSYLYASDLTTCLWNLLLRGPICEPVDVGSDERLSIYDLACLVARLLKVEVDVTNKAPQPYDNYLPENPAHASVHLEEAILKTARWYE